MSNQLTVRLPEDLSRAVAQAATRLQRKRSEIVRLALYQFLKLPQGAGDTPAARFRSGSFDFEIVLDLVPVVPEDGFSASYELDCVGIVATSRGNQCDFGTTVFVDGLESGDTTTWSRMTPPSW